jgi:hypothetical protein
MIILPIRRSGSVAICATVTQVIRIVVPLEEPEQEYDLFAICKPPTGIITGIITASQQAASS